MTLILGGQTIYDSIEDRPLIFLDHISVSTGDDTIEEYVSVFDGNEISNIEGDGLGHIFLDDIREPDRRMYYGNYCNGLIYEGIDEDEIVKRKKEVKSYLRSVTNNIKKNKLFTKAFKQ